MSLLQDWIRRFDFLNYYAFPWKLKTYNSMYLKCLCLKAIVGIAVGGLRTRARQWRSKGTCGKSYRSLCRGGSRKRYRRSTESSSTLTWTNSSQLLRRNYVLSLRADLLLSALILKAEKVEAWLAPVITRPGNMESSRVCRSQKLGDCAQKPLSCQLTFRCTCKFRLES